jgi:PAS domain S-box-containing protein
MPDAARQLELYRLLVDKSLGLMCIHDLDGVLLALNPAVGRSLGYSPGAGVGRNLKEFLAPEVRPLFDDYVRKIRLEGFHAGLMRLVASDGSERIWTYRNILYQESGAAPIVLGHALDVTEQARAEQALRESRRELARARDDLARRVVERTAALEQANARLLAEIDQRKAVEEELLRARKLESLGVLAGGIAHDINNFLTVIQGNIALARLEAPPESPLLESLEQAEAACLRAAALANQLLTFAKGGAPVRKPRSIARLLQEAVDLARAGSPAGIRLSVSPDLSFAEIDAAQMSQVMHNILLNARQATPHGGTIEVEAENVDAPPLCPAAAFASASATAASASPSRTYPKSSIPTSRPGKAEPVSASPPPTRSSGSTRD